MRVHWFRATAIALLTTISSALPAAEIRVPTDQPTIQAGIDAAADGDTVLVADGVYTGNGNRDMYFRGKAITVVSENGPDHCVIDLQGSLSDPHRAFWFHQGEGPDSVLEGFTIRNGYTPDRGSAIWCSSSPTIKNNYVIYNDGPSWDTGAIYCWYSAPRIVENLVAMNDNMAGIAMEWGGEPFIADNVIFHNQWDGINCLGTNPATTISDNLILENRRYGIATDHAELDILRNQIVDNRLNGIAGEYSAMDIEGNIITGNSGSHGAGIRCGGNNTITNCLIAGNESVDYGGGIYFYRHSTTSDQFRLTGCTVTGNSAVDGGGGIYNGEADVIVYDTILYNNTAPVGPEIYLGHDTFGGGDFTINWSDVESGRDLVFIDPEADLFWGTGMISVDPLFTAGPLGGHYLSQTAAGQPANSPCVDVGWPLTEIPEGTTRTDGVQDVDTVDMGYHHPLQDGPQIGITPLWLSFEGVFPGGTPEEQVINIRSLDGSLLEWSISSGADWLNFSPGSGSCTSEVDQVTLSVVPGAAGPGEYVTVVKVLGIGAGNSPLKIPVSLVLADGPPSPWIVAGPGPAESNPAMVRSFPPVADAGHDLEFTAYGVQKFGVNIACGDVTGTDRAVIITGAGPGAVFGPHVRGFGSTGSPLPGLSFLAYGTNKYGVNVAAGDLSGNGVDEIITGAGPGAEFGPHVRGWSYNGSAMTSIPGVSFFAYGTLKWGANVAAGDLDGDGFDEIVTGAGPGPVFGPHVRGWNVDGGSAAAMAGVSFFAYGTPRYGVQVSCGDVDGDGIDEIVTAPGPSPLFGAHIRGWNHDGESLTPLPGLSFFAWPPQDMLYGAEVWAGTDLDDDGRSEIITGPGPDPFAGTPLKVFRYNGSSVTEWLSLEAFPSLTHGATVAAGWF